MAVKKYNKQQDREEVLIEGYILLSTYAELTAGDVVDSWGSITNDPDEVVEDYDDSAYNNTDVKAFHVKISYYPEDTIEYEYKLVRKD